MAQGDFAKVGANSWVAMFPESTYGTMSLTSSANLQTLQPISVGFQTSFDSQKLDQLSVNRGYTQRVQLNKNVGGSLETHFHPEESLHLFVNAMGGTFTFSSITSGSLYSITAGNWGTGSTIGSLSFAVGKGDAHTVRYSGGVVSNLKLTAKVGEPAKLSCEMIFQDSSISSADTLTTVLSFSTIAPFTFVDGVFRYDATEASAGSSAANQPIQEFSLELENGLVQDDQARQLGSRLLSRRPPATRREVKLSTTQRFDTLTSFNQMVQATEGSVELYFVGATISAEYNREVFIRLPRVVLASGGDPEIGGPDVIQNTLEWDVLISGNAATTTSRELGVTWRSARISSI